MGDEEKTCGVCLEAKPCACNSRWYHCVRCACRTPHKHIHDCDKRGLHIGDSERFECVKCGRATRSGDRAVEGMHFAHDKAAT